MLIYIPESFFQWINGKEVMQHVGGHLPFEAEVGSFFISNGANRLTVAVNNTLGPHTLPPGTISHHHGPEYVGLSM